MKSVLFSLLALSVLASCSSGKDQKNEPNPDDKKLSYEASYEAEIAAIDEEIASKGQLATSLRYTKENGAYILVHGHLTEDGKMLKMDEEFNDGNDGNYGTNSFYFKDTKLFATREYFEDRSNKSSPKFVERISYYSKEEKIEKTLEKRVDFEEELENVDFKPVTLHEIKIDRAKRVFEQSGEFETTFQGFVAAQYLNYLVLGSPEKDAYTTAVRVNSEDNFIRLLLKDERKYLNKKIQISFENVIDATGFEYQAYISGSFVE